MNGQQPVINANTFQLSEELKNNVWTLLCASAENFLRISHELNHIARNESYQALIHDFPTLFGKYNILKLKLVASNTNTPIKEYTDTLIEIMQYSSELYDATKTLHESYPNVLKNPFLPSTTTHPSNQDKNE